MDTITNTSTASIDISKKDFCKLQDTIIKQQAIIVEALQLVSITLLV